VGDGDAICALNWRWEAAWVVVNDGQRVRRRSGEELRSGRGNAVE
jgi:hypothetical protein